MGERVGSNVRAWRPSVENDALSLDGERRHEAD